MTSNQDTRTAAEVLYDQCRQHHGLMDIGDGTVPECHEIAKENIAALADAGFTIAKPGQVVLDRGRWERVRAAAEMWDGRIIGSVYLYAMPEPGDLDPLPTQEGE
jgi:hypothetical protein